MESQLKPWSPRLWWTHLVLLIVLTGTVLLGYWQWHVSRDHRTKQVIELSHATPKPLASVFGHDDPFPGGALGRPSVITGVWVPSGTMYVSQPNGGYWVITPIAVGAETDPAIYVVRGASATTTSPAVSGAVSVVGWLEPDDEAGGADPDPSDDVLPQLQLSLAAPHLHQDLYDGYAVIADDQGTWDTPTTNDGTTGLTPVPPPAAPKADPTTGLRNLLYAFEWWIFGCLAIYIWWRYLADVTHPASEEAQDDAVPSKP